MTGTDFQEISRAGRNRYGFWIVAVAFTTVMAFTTVPTPLWSMYAERDRFSSLTVTIVFGVYALAVAVSLFVVGHVSDWYGRRRVLIPALALEMQLLTAAIPTLLMGLGLLTAALWLPSPSLGVFLVGDLVVGVGSGLMFKGAIATVAEVSSEEHRAEALAGLFLAAYLGLAVPVVGLGALTLIASTRVSLLVFAGLLAAGTVGAAPALLGRGTARRSPQPQPTSP